jgi:CHAD domain-containing protein
MPYRLKSGESISEGVKRIALEETQSAAALLAGATARNRDEAIHEARKSVKKTRALLRLMRPEIEPVYAKENTRLRNIGRRLSAYRDRAVLIETFDALQEKYTDDLKGATLASIRQGLLLDKRRQQRGAGMAQALQRIAAGLRAAAARTSRWPLEADGFEALAPGLTAAYRKARRAMAAVRAEARPELCHEWRKRVKDHWYHIRLVEDLWTEVMAGYEKSLKELETWLGDHHNLEVLKATLTAHPRQFGRSANIQLCLDLAAKYQKELLANSLSLGERVYEERAREYRTRMGHLWDSWQNQPKSLEEIEKQQRQAAQW